MAQVNDLRGKFDKLLGIWDDKTDRLPTQEIRQSSLAATAEDRKHNRKVRDVTTIYTV